jgi:rhodanese-related sulfurtransferase
LLRDFRNPDEYREAHIPGALNIHQKRMNDFWRLVPVQGYWIRRKRFRSTAIQAAAVTALIKSSRKPVIRIFSGYLCCLERGRSSG